VRRLPRGRHGLSPEFVAQDQRDRLLVAISETLGERGYEGTTVSAIGSRAHVSKSDFYRHFGSKDACFLAAYDDAVERLREEVVAACSERDEWVDGVCAGIAVVLAWLAREPGCANLLLVEGLRAGPRFYDRFLAGVQSFVPYLRDRAPEGGAGGQTGAATAEAVVGGVASLLGRHVLAGETEQLERFFPDFAEFALTPYLGTAEARRIISGR
jgi:AcrR family transcriptional regulator